jgi:HAD superfamily hydrolase (TIGR01662 family)
LINLNHDLKVILFDLGRTLLYPRQPWPKILSLADQALFKALESAGILSEPRFSPDEFQVCMNEYYDQRIIDQVELSAVVVLTEFLRSKGFSDVPDKVLRDALDAMYSITQSNWHIEEDSIATLKELKMAGYRLGLISNASDDWDVQQLIDRRELRPFFEFILTSAACGWRKPHPHMFQRALAHFAAQPSQVAMIGDTLTEDVAGAENVGIYSIWLTRRAVMPPDGNLPIQPQAIISNLNELPGLLSEIRLNS